MQPPELTLVRRVRAADWQLLKAQRIEMIADTPIAYGETVAQAQARPDEHWRGKAASQEQGGVLTKLLAFTESGALAGAAGGWADETGAPRTFVVGVYIAPAYRGRGLLATLVQRIGEWSIEHGRPELVLEVARENPRAVAAYEKLGFTATGESRPHELYPEITELVMVRTAVWESQPSGSSTGLMTGAQRLKAVVNWVNLMTPLGLLTARIGGGTARRGPHGLYIGTGYRPKVPIAGAFTLGNVVTTRHGPEYLLAEDRADLLAHEIQHSVQAAILGPLFLPAYFAASAYSYLVGKDWGSRNPFEVWAGLEAGRYERKPLRPGLVRLLRRPSGDRPGF